MGGKTRRSLAVRPRHKLMDIPRITVQDVEKCLRTGGPLDVTFVLTQCLGCGQSVSRSLRWFYEQPHICAACGGALDPAPLRQASMATLKDYESALERHYRLRDPAG